MSQSRTKVALPFSVRFWRTGKTTALRTRAPASQHTSAHTRVIVAFFLNKTFN